MGVGLVSYSMTHHTRQSALGLPVIVRKEYEGMEYEVSEYTMSEIISAVYDKMRETGVKEGILFLDEINCVSETLAPVMLQFLQYKVFGRHSVPAGWMVVTAGNPPEYNDSVREFDIVTWDRLKRIDIEPDYGAWKEYALSCGIHPAVLTYLEIRKEDFYRVETSVDGKEFVTARGWEDLSRMLQSCEKHGLTVNENLVGQYLQSRKIAKRFAVYYDLFKKYRRDYNIESILNGTWSGDIQTRAEEAGFDERLSLLGLLLDGVTLPAKTVLRREEILGMLREESRRLSLSLKKEKASPAELFRSQTEERREELKKGIQAGNFSVEKQYLYKKTIQCMEQWQEAAEGSGEDLPKFLKAACLKEKKEAAAQAEQTKDLLSNAFRFLEVCFGEGQELLIFVTELTLDPHTAKFIGRYGCEAYFRHNKSLLFYERKKELYDEIDRLEESEKSEE